MLHVLWLCATCNRPSVASHARLPGRCKGSMMNQMRSYCVPPDMAQSQLLRCLKDARALLADRACWDQTGSGPGWCPLRAVSRAAATAKVRFPFILTLRATLLLRAAVPASHRSWWPECVVRYNDDPTVTHADILAWLDRAIATATPLADTRTGTSRATGDSPRLRRFPVTAMLNRGTQSPRRAGRPG
jgi:hypothetical protein